MKYDAEANKKGGWEREGGREIRRKPFSQLAGGGWMWSLFNVFIIP